MLDWFPSITCRYVCIHQQIGQTQSKETHKPLLVKHIFLGRNYILMGICQMLLLQLHFDIDSVLNEDNVTCFMRLMAVVTD